MQEENLNKKTNKVLLVSIFAVIAILLVSASFYLVFRAMGGDKREEPKEEVKEEMVVKKEKTTNTYLPESDSDEENDYSNFCNKWKNVDFGEVNEEAGSVDLTGTVIKKIENAPFVENEKVINVYFVISKPSTQAKQVFYDNYFAMVEYGNSVNDIDGENLLFKLGMISEEGEFLSTSDISDDLKNKIFSIIDMDDSIDLGLTIPSYEGGGAPSHFSFACEIVDGGELLKEKVNELYNNDWDLGASVLRPETWPMDESDKIDVTEGYVLVTSVLSNNGDKVAYFEADGYFMNIGILDLSNLESKIINHKEWEGGCVRYDYLPVVWSVNDEKIVLEAIYAGGGCSVPRAPINKVIDLNTLEEEILTVESPIFIDNNEDVIYIERAEWDDFQVCGLYWISDRIVKKNVESGKIEVLVANENESYGSIFLDENANLLYSYSDIVFNEEKKCYKFDQRYIENEAPELSVLELK